MGVFTPMFLNAATGREERSLFDGLDWPQQVEYVTNHDLDAPMMRHITQHGDPAARMALALKPDLPDMIRRRLSADPNPQVRFNLIHGPISGDA